MISKRLCGWALALAALAICIPGGLAFADDATSVEEIQAAIAAAPDGEQTDVAVSGDISAATQVVVPSGKNIRLTVAGGGSGSLTAATSSINYLVKVESGATLSIDGGLVLDGDGKAYYVTNEGSFTLEDGDLKNGKRDHASNGGGVYSKGADATFTMNGGTISNTTALYSGQGAVCLDKGAVGFMNGGTVESTAVQNQLSSSVLVNASTFTMDGGTITGGNAGHQLQTSGGVLVFACENNTDTGVTSRFTMNGGTISNCKSPFGGGVYVYGGSPNYRDFRSKAYFTMNGGTITGNEATGVVSVSGDFISGGGGGVYVENGSTFDMNDGVISNNKAAGMGGGVAAFDNFVTFFGKVPYSSATGQYYEAIFSKWPEFYPAAFTMNGGSIVGNKAEGDGVVNDGGCGGGVYSASSLVTLNAGLIDGNTADRQGGGAYVGSVPYVLNAYDVVVTSNHASVIGGGAWFCPTGKAAFSVNNGAAVYGNDAQGAADDVAAVRMAGEEATTTISDRMLGGGAANWYKDGGILVPHVLGEPDPDAPRYDPASSSNVPVSGISESTDIFVLKATPTPAAIDLAQSKAKLTITNNSAARGGGIGSNGASTLGKVNVHTKKVVVKKVWDTSANPDAAIPGSIKVWLLIDGKRIESVELTKDSGWTHTFEGLPLNADVSIEEDEAVEGWTAKVTSEEVSETEIAFTITNTPDAKSTSVSVKKVWDDADNKDGSRPASVKVQLYANGEAYGDPVVLNSDSNWTYTWTGLPVMKDGSAVEYTVAEVDVPKGYKARIAGSASEGFTITNVKEPTKPPAKEQPKKPRISKIPATGDDLGAMTFALAGASVASIACIAAARRKMRG